MAADYDLVDLVSRPAWKSILFDLIKKEKIVPWDIDISKLANAYMEKIQELKKFSFKIPANAVLVASILLAMKAKSIQISSYLADFEEEYEREEELDELLEEEEFTEYSTEDQPPAKQVVFEPDLKPPERISARPVTIDELMFAIQKILDKTTTPRPRSPRKAPYVPDIKLPKETIEKRINATYNKLKELADSQSLVKFSDITDTTDSKQVLKEFLPLLYLANNQKINIWQDEFFGEIFIKVLR